MLVDEHISLWQRCLNVIKDNVADVTFNTWFAPIIPLKFENKVLTVQVPSQFFYEFIEDKFVDLLRMTLYREIGEGVQLMYSVIVDNNTKTGTNIPSTNAPTTKGAVKFGNKAPKAVLQELDTQLKSTYSFDNFIEGESNKLSRTAGEAVAQKPAKTSFNPLFLHGKSGVGKTHLANAIGLRVKELYPEKRVLYVSAHLFQIQFTDSIRNNTTNDFINFYQTIDVLIIDDVQEFAGKTATQNNFFHVFNHLHQNGKQLILTADRAPILLQGMEERLLTRFKWGLSAELESPDIELRKGILRNKIYRDGLNISEEVITYIAEHISDSVRDLEGVIISLMAYSVIYNKDIDLDLTERIVSKAVKAELKVISIEHIIQKACKHYNIEEVALHSKSRKRELVQVRQVAMYLSKKYTDCSSSKIGEMIGKRDHATVLHACKIVKDQIEVDKKFKSDVVELESMLRKRD